MVDENIVMYYSHRYDRILISEAEKTLPKKYVWVEVNVKNLKKGDVIGIESNCVSKDIIIRIFNYYTPLGGCIVYHYDNDRLVDNIDQNYWKIYKAIEV